MEGFIIDSDNDDIVMDNDVRIMMENCRVIHFIFSILYSVYANIWVLFIVLLEA